MKNIIKLFISFMYSLAVMATIHVVVEFVWNETVDPFFLGWITCYNFLHSFNFLRG